MSKRKWFITFDARVQTVFTFFSANTIQTFTTIKREEVARFTSFVRQSRWYQIHSSLESMKAKVVKDVKLSKLEWMYQNCCDS